MIFRTTRSGQIIEQFEHESKVTRSDEDEKMEVMRPLIVSLTKRNASISLLEQLSSIKERYLKIIVVNSL